MAIGGGKKKLSNLGSAISLDTEIDLESKAELLANLTNQSSSIRDSDAGLGQMVETFKQVEKASKGIGSSFAAAKAGTDPIYKTRRLFQSRRQSVLSQPGRSQTVLTR